MQRREELTKSGADSGGANDEELGKLVGQLTLEEKVRLQDLLSTGRPSRGSGLD